MRDKLNPGCSSAHPGYACFRILAHPGPVNRAIHVLFADIVPSIG